MIAAVVALDDGTGPCGCVVPCWSGGWGEGVWEDCPFPIVAARGMPDGGVHVPQGWVKERTVCLKVEEVVETHGVRERPRVPHPLLVESKCQPLTPEEAIDEINMRWNMMNTTITGIVMRLVYAMICPHGVPSAVPDAKK